MGSHFSKSPFEAGESFLRTHFSAVQAGPTGAARFDHVESCESEERKESNRRILAPRGRQSLRRSDDQSESTRFNPLLSSPDSLANLLKLLDHGEVLEATRPKKDTSRKQPLPATYEPGKVAPVLFLKRRVIFFIQNFLIRQENVSLVEAKKGLRHRPGRHP
jgi:DNA ligase-1